LLGIVALRLYILNFVSVGTIKGRSSSLLAGACLDEDDETWKRILSEMTFRGLEIWDLRIIELGFLGRWGRLFFRALKQWVERNGRRPAHGPSTDFVTL
jgi:hypothetical protein